MLVNREMSGRRRIARIRRKRWENKGNEWGLDEAFFKESLKDKKRPAILLLDGLDEPSSRIEREAIARLCEKATRAYERCRFVVTTRP